MRFILAAMLLFIGALLFAGSSPYGEVVIDGRLYDVRYYDHRGEPQFLKVRRDVDSEWPVVDWYGGAPYVLNGKIGMVFKERVNAAARTALLKRFGLKVEQNPVTAPDYYLTAMRKGIDPFQLAEDIRQSGLVEWVQPDWYMALTTYADPTPVVPDDTYYSWQWHHAKIRSELAWAILPAEHGKADIAVVDCGTDMQHPDLIDNIVVGAGYDFIDGDADPDAPTLAMSAGYAYKKLAAHGTCVAGVAAGRGNNAKGIAGVCWDCGIIPIRLIDNTGDGTAQNPPKDTSSRVLEALMLAVDAGAAVINNSWGPYNPNCAAAPFNNFVEYGNIYAVKKGRDGLGAVMVWAAGNDYCDTANNPNLANQHIVVVSSIRYNTLGEPSDEGNGYKATYSNFGDEITIAAPGGDPIDGQKYNGLMTTDLSGGAGYEANDYLGVENFTGTSAAAPVAAGAIALMLEAKADMPINDALHCIKQAAANTRQARIDAGDMIEHIIRAKDMQTEIGTCSWTDLADPYLAAATPHNPCYGYGYLDVYEMVRMAVAGECDDWQIPVCAEDGDCPEGQRCDVASGRCFLVKTCTDDSECLSGNCEEESGVCIGGMVPDKDTALPDDTVPDQPAVDNDTALPDDAVTDNGEQPDDAITDDAVSTDAPAPDSEPDNGGTPGTPDEDLFLEEEPVGCGCSLI